MWKNDISSENESGGESSSSDSVQPTLTGNTLKELPEFDKEKLTVCKMGTDSYNILYNNDSELYLMSGQYLGNIQMLNSKFCSSILVKKRRITWVSAWASGENDWEQNKTSSCAFFPQASRNLEIEKCLDKQNCGVPELIPID